MSLVEDWKNQSVLIKTIAVVLPALATLLTIIVSADPALTALDQNGVPIIATRGFVRGETGNMKTQIVDIQIDLARGKRDANQAARNKLEIDALNLPDDTSKIKSQQEMRRLDDTISALNEQIRVMMGVKGPR